MKEFQSFTDLRSNMYLIPEIVAFDVIVNINSWMLEGGNLEDKYVKDQLKFASEFIEK